MLDLKIIKKGTYINLYEHPYNQNIVIKQLRNVADIPIFGAGDEVENRPTKCWGKCGPGWGVGKDMGFCNQNGCNLIQYIMWKSAVAGMWRMNQAKIKLQNQTDNLTKIYYMNEPQLYWEEERLSKPKLTRKDINQNVHQQLHRLNALFRKYNLKMFDAHIGNFGMQGNTIKHVDGEILSGFEAFMFWLCYEYIRGYSMRPYEYFDCIYFTNEPTNFRGPRRVPVSKWVAP